MLESSRNVYIRLTKFAGWDCWWIYFQNNSDIPIKSREFNMIEIFKGYHYRISYDMMSYKLLESPYPTNCQNYRKTSDYYSQKDCIRKCKLNTSLTNCGSIGYEVNVIKGEPSVRFTTGSEGKCIEKIDFNMICTKMCPKIDCIIKYYKPKFISLPAALDKKNNHVEMEFYVSNEPEHTFIHKPRIELIEFICYIASTLSIWFGFSMISIYYGFKSISNSLNINLYLLKLININVIKHSTNSLSSCQELNITLIYYASLLILFNSLIT